MMKKITIDTEYCVLKNYYDKNLNKLFSNKRDIIVADSLLELFRIRQNIENFNKKLYLTDLDFS